MRPARFLLFALACVLAAGAVAQAPRLDAREQTKQVASLFRAGNIQEARRILAGIPPDALGAEGRYFAGKLARQGGEARRHFQAVARMTGSGYADDALMELAESVYSDPQGLYLSARRAFQRVLTSYPDSPHAPLATYRIARTFLITSTHPHDAQADSARFYLSRIVTRYPGSSAALQAGQILAAEGREGSEMPTVWSVGGAVVDWPAGAETVKPFWVQAGAFSTRALADALASRLRGHSMGVRLVSSGKMTLVQVGPYASLDRAESASRHISLVESLACTVIQE